MRKQTLNKKVLLRERKRHTARHVLGGYLPWPGGGVPHLARGYLPWPGGYPTLAGGYPTLGRYPPWPGGYLSWMRGVPTLAGGYPALARGVPTLARMGYPTGCEQTDAYENSTFRHPSDVGGNHKLLHR